ncbi:MAG: tetratricopeptide repeat protein [Desulfuromusa sp.]|nr:tetratricopeptide repeat protein [Desulfuromusa sp.]
MTEQNQQSLLLGKIAAYTEILVKDPSSTIFISLAETYRKMGMFADARQIIYKGMDLHPDVSPAYIVLARTLCQLEDFDGAVVAFERALELDQDSLAALVGYARVQILLGDEVIARQLLLRAREISPADPVINKLLLSLPEGDVEPLDVPVSTGDEAVEPAPVLVSATLAELYLVQGLTEKALDLFQQLSVQNPDDLTLRRKVKELEGQLREENQDGTEKSTDLLLKQREDIPAAPVESIDAAEVAIEQLFDSGKETTVSAPVNTPSCLDTLNLWLSNIKQRRGNV